MVPSERSRSLTVSQALSHRATTDPEGIFLLTEKGALSYGELEGKAESLAAALAHLGVVAGDRVAVVLPGCPEFVVTFFALAKLGAIVVPLDPRLTGAEFQYMLRHSEAVCAVTVESYYGVDYLQLFEELLPVLPELQYLVTVGEEDLWYDDRIFQFEDLLSAGVGRDFDGSGPPGGGGALLALVYTSGTSGKPKGVELTHESLLHAAAATVEGIGLRVGDRMIGITALHHVFGLGPGLLGAVLSGATLILVDPVDPAVLLDRIVLDRATVLFGVPSLFAAELREQRTRRRDLRSLRIGLVAGAPMASELFAAVEAELCPLLLTGYSLTETSSTLAITRPDDSVEKRRFTAGRPIEGMEILVLEEDGTPLPTESLGELAVRGPGVMRGYYRQPRETAELRTPDGYLRTGDLGIMDEDGYIHLVGRRKDVIIRSGSKVYPREIEDRILAHPAVATAAVVGIRDEFLGEAVCAVVVPVEGAIVSGPEIREWCRRTLADHKGPAVVRFTESLPMTGTGKVRRLELARLVEAEREGSAL